MGQQGTDAQRRRAQYKIHLQKHAAAAVGLVPVALGAIFHIKAHQRLAKAQVQHGEKGNHRGGHGINTVFVFSQMPQQNGCENNAHQHIDTPLDISQQRAQALLIVHSKSLSPCG